MRRGRVSVAAICLAVFTLSACNATEEPLGAPSASPASTTSAKVKQPTHRHSPQQKTVHSVVKGTHGSPSKALLDEYVAQSQKQLDTQLADAFKNLYSDISIRPSYPSGVEIVYVFKQAVSPSVATDSLNQSAPILRKTFTTLMAPEMKTLGFAHPSATWTYRNPDGSLVWTITYP
jgi:hypothetical protein